MYFLCLIHVDDGALEALSPAEREAFDRDNEAYGKWLVASGHSIASSALHAPATATLIRSRDGKISMTDGPYVETKEHLGGFMLLEARDRDEALAIAQRSPPARIGTVEVRQAYFIQPA